MGDLIRSNVKGIDLLKASSVIYISYHLPLLRHQNNNNNNIFATMRRQEKQAFPHQKKLN